MNENQSKIDCAKNIFRVELHHHQKHSIHHLIDYKILMLGSTTGYVKYLFFQSYCQFNWCHRINCCATISIGSNQVQKCDGSFSKGVDIDGVSKYSKEKI